MNIFVLSKNNKLKQIIERSGKNFVIDSCRNKNEIVNRLFSSPVRVDVLFATEDLDGRGRTADALVEVRRSNPLLKIIYVNNLVDKIDNHVASIIETLVNNNIYNIYFTKQISGKLIAEMIDKEQNLEYAQSLLPKREEPVVMAEARASAPMQQNVAPAMAPVRENNYSSNNEYTPNVSVPRINTKRDNVYVFSSIKPGSGKSFISSNVAVAIAKDGVNSKYTGKKPTVLLIEADLQTLSVANLFGVDPSMNNLKDVLNRISRIVDDNGEIIGSDAELKQIDSFIYSKCVRIDEVPNLHILTGSNLNLSDIQNISPFQYFYLLDTVSTMFDIVIVDANSSLEHKTTGPILQLAKECFMMINPDYNSLKINRRYQQDLVALGVMNKVKYILNKNFTAFQRQNFASKMQFDLDAELDNWKIFAKIPEVDPTIAYNCIFNHLPVYLDDSVGTLQARAAIAKIANHIYPVDVFEQLMAEVVELKKELGIKDKKPKKDKKKK